MKFLFAILSSIIYSITLGQTFTQQVLDTILDNSPNAFSQTISGLPNTIDETNFGVESVCINLTHSYIADLSISIVAPDGTRVLLVSGMGGDTDYYTNTCFAASSTTSIGQGTSPYTATFIPMGQLGAINNLQNPNGDWILEVNDTWAQDAGNMIEWSITFGANPASIFSISESSLPIVMIETNGQEIPNEPKLNSTVKIIYNGENIRNYTNQTDVHFQGNCGIETRGASSSGMPKKSYDLEIRDAVFADLDTSILGFPSESDFVLSAQYTDKSLIRNMLSMHLIQGMGWYAPRFKPVELFINNLYQGVYIFMEKVKRDSSRVAISKLNPTEISGDDLTGGYILKLDKNSGTSNLGWESPFAPIPSGSPIVIDYYYPDESAIVTEQMNYIRNYFTDFEQSLASTNFADPQIGYRQFVNYNSCLDALIISEFTRSIDAYRKSFYIYKDKDSKGGKLVMAPIWDYDLTFGNANFCNGESTEGWQYNFNYVCGGDYWVNPFWFPRMMEDTLFQNDLRCRWNQLRSSTLHPDSIDMWINQFATKLMESQSWNYIIWPTMGSYIWPNSFVGQTYQEEIDFLKTWMRNRFAWLDANIPGDSVYCTLNASDLKSTEHISIYPNPTQNDLVIQSPSDIQFISIVDQSGKSMLTPSIVHFHNYLKLNISHFNPGIYYIKIITEKGSYVQKIQRL